MERRWELIGGIELLLAAAEVADALEGLGKEHGGTCAGVGQRQIRVGPRLQKAILWSFWPNLV